MSTSPVPQVRLPVSAQVSRFAFARIVTRARGGISGTDSVKDFRSQEPLVHNHLRLCNRSAGRSVRSDVGWSRGHPAPSTAWTRPRTTHTPQPTAERCPPRPCGCRRGRSGRLRRRCRQVRTRLNDCWACSRLCCRWICRNTQFTKARALDQSPTRSRSVTPDPHQVGIAFIPGLAGR